MENEIIKIDIDAYDNAFAEWCLQVFKKAIDDYSAMHRFDKTLGLELTDEQDDCLNYSFIIVDKKKFFVAKIRYGF